MNYYFWVKDMSISKVSKEREGAGKAIGMKKATYVVTGNDDGIDAYG